MITFPNCKINLGLHVVGKRPDGYHDLETIFLPVMDMCDELEIVEVESGKWHPEGELNTLEKEKNAVKKAESVMVQDGIALDNAPDDNLCMKAWRLLHEEFGIPTVSIRLKKNIPFGAGLGGGSSDAAFTLKMLNEIFSLGLDNSALEQRAAKLGADCAFFIRNCAAYATGIGDQLEPLEWKVAPRRGTEHLEKEKQCSEESGKWKVVIEVPDGEHVSTKEAYAGLGERLKVKGERCDLRECVKRPIEEWRDLIVNDFEASVFPTHPAIAALKDDMYRRGALYASMTGSGAAVFGIFPK